MSPDHSGQAVVSGGDSSVCSNDACHPGEHHSSSSDSGRCTDQEPPCTTSATRNGGNIVGPIPSQHRRVMFDASNNSFRTLTPASRAANVGNLNQAGTTATTPHVNTTTPTTTGSPSQTRAIHYKNNERVGSPVDV